MGFVFGVYILNILCNLKMKPDSLKQPDSSVNSVKHHVTLPCLETLINVKISDVLTPVTCALLINEILQGLLYQKSQIPYPYNWLKSVVDKKRGSSNTEEVARKVNLTASNHFRVVSKAYDTIESIMKGIITEFTDKSDIITEVFFVFGTTPLCPKEVYSIHVSPLAKGQLERNHINPICNCRQKILRNIFLSQDWMDAVDSSMACTNTYIFLKTIGSCNKDCDIDSSNSNFTLCRPLTLSPKVKHVKIHLNYEVSEKSGCCDNFAVFEDVSDKVTTRQNSESEEITNWYQSKDLFKGFKDCYINKVSATELW